ncbi:MAG TPA: IPT/TIG domain-containing protein [Terriglobales bacterium]|nr:IPT/TIG domain-containing protein [Terriglobales bacterium]
MRHTLPTVQSGTGLFARIVPFIFMLFLFGCGGSSSSPTPRVPPGPPSLDSLSPSSGVFGSAITITGTNFGTSQGSSTVTFNGQTASAVSWTPATIVAKVPSGATTGNVVVTVDGNASNGVNFTVVALPTGSIAPSYFGFQCGIGDTADCGNANGTVVVWPSTQAQPGMLRLHDTGTQWANIEGAGAGQYQWNNLDAWLDAIATHQPLDVIEVFTWVPCWDVPNPNTECSSPPTSPVGTNTPPGDLTADGSPSFNTFVTAFVTHCSANNNCVKDYIKYYEMWNEWDISYHWTGTMAQVYQMVAPAASIIKSNITDAVILTPSTTPDSDTGLGYQADLQNWLNYETQHGRISDWIAWHVYLTVGNSQNEIVTPETQWGTYNVNFLSIQASTSGWTTTPWADTETNYNGAPPPGLNYSCPQSSSPSPPVTFSADDCAGMIARWQLLHDSNGAVSVDWYKWNETIGSNPQYETVYYNLMQYLVGGKFGGPCSFTAANGATTWTCSFTEAPPNNTQALWVWTPNEAGTSYTVPSGYTDYKDLQGNTHTVTAGTSITIGVEPFMLEQ